MAAIYEILDNKGLTYACKNVKLRKNQKEALNNFVAIIETCRDFLDTSSPSEILKEIINQTNFRKVLQKDYPDEYEERVANVNELINIAADYATISDFIDSISVNDEEVNPDENDKSEKVSMMTMHGSKGLEFPFVIIVGANEGIVPGDRSIMEGNLQEERRLFYVAMTRAKENLFISYPKIVISRGMPVPAKPSRFIGEISKEYVERI